MTDLLDHQLAALHRRRRLQRVIERWVPVTTLGVAVAATTVMVIRLAAPGLEGLALGLACGGILAGLVVVPSAWRPRDRRADLAGHLDQLVDGRGLAMALAAQPADQRDADWAARMRQPLESLTLPALRWPGAGGLALAALVLAVGLLIPQQHPDSSRINPVQALFAGLEASLDRLEDLGATTPEQIIEHRAKLEELKAQAGRTGMDQAIWMARDRLDEALRADAAAATRRLAEALAQAEVGATSPAAATQAAEALAQQLGELAARAPGLVPKLDGENAQALREALAQAVQQGLLTPQQEQALGRLGIRPNQGAQAGLNGEQQRQLAERIQRELERRAQELGTCEGGEGMGEALGEARGRGNGRGGLGRGPGHTDHPRFATDPLGIGQVDDLPPGARVNPDGSITLAEQVRDPDLEAAALQEAARAAARTFDPAAADARSARLAPRHRATVGRYFAAPTTDTPVETPP